MENQISRKYKEYWKCLELHSLIQQYLTYTQDRQCPLGNKHFINLPYESFLLLVYAIFSGMLQH